MPGEGKDLCAAEACAVVRTFRSDTEPALTLARRCYDTALQAGYPLPEGEAEEYQGILFFNLTIVYDPK